MDMLTNEQIASTGLTDWRKLAQGLHARYAVESFSAGARFVAAIADVWVAPEVAAARIAAAVAAGGVVVDDTQAPSFTVVADPDGNRACVCTSLRETAGGVETP